MMVTYMGYRLKLMLVLFPAPAFESIVQVLDTKGTHWVCEKNLLIAQLESGETLTITAIMIRWLEIPLSDK